MEVRDVCSVPSPLQSSKGRARAYVVALVALTAALGARALLRPILGLSMQYSFSLLATAFAIWYCGLWPAILVALLGGLGAAILFFGPISTLGSFAAVLLYVLMCGSVIAAGHVNRRSLKALQATRSVLLDARASLEDQVRRRTAELECTNQGLRDLSRRLLQVQDEERRRIARNLHDSTGQVLAALSMSLSSLRRQASKTSPPISAALAENEELVKDLTHELRTLSHLLHPPLLDEVGLASALRWYAEGFEGRSSIRTRLEMPAENGRLAPEMETALFRVVQEGLTNIHRHSASPSATIRVDRLSDRVALEIEDQGRGIPPERLEKIRSGAQAGIGLRGMRERIEELGGKFEIASNATGTRVKVTLPLLPISA
jgi:signal transduction histidine kinase